VSAWWIAWAAAVVGVFWLQVRRAVQADRRIVRALLEAEPGINPGDQSECERIWSMPAYDPDGTAGFDRLRQAVRDEQQKGETA
jgi:hypothetical protein